MSDLFNRITGDQDFVRKIFSKIPGFSGYIERENRRASDKILRDSIANRFEQIWSKISSLQRDLISQGGIAYIDDLEVAALKLRQFIDRIRNAAYGYAGFFDAIKINQEELATIYQYDLTMIELSDQVSRAVDNVEASFGTDGLPAAIRHLVTLSQQAVDTYEKRSEVIIGGFSPGQDLIQPPNQTQ